MRDKLTRGENVLVEISNSAYVVFWIDHASRPCFEVKNTTIPSPEAWITKREALAELRLALEAMELVTKGKASPRLFSRDSDLSISGAGQCSGLDLFYPTSHHVLTPYTPYSLHRRAGARIRGIRNVHVETYSLPSVEKRKSICASVCPLLAPPLAGHKVL